MKFKVNGNKWSIERTDGVSLKHHYNSTHEDKTQYVFGLCDFIHHTIYINEDVCFDQQLHTLKHELAHCWIFSIGCYYADLNEEMVCDIISTSNDFINEVVEKYKNTYEKRS